MATATGQQLPVNTVLFWAGHPAPTYTNTSTFVQAGLNNGAGIAKTSAAGASNVSATGAFVGNSGSGMLIGLAIVGGIAAAVYFL